MRRSMMIIGCLVLAGGALTIAPLAEALEFRVQKYDPYSPTTPYIYRRSRPSNSCQLRGNSLLTALFPPEQYTCSGGWTFPSLIQGACPVYTCVLKVKENPNSPFGPLNW